MNNKITDIINKLCALHTLEHNEYKQLLDNYSVEAREILADTAVAERKKIYGNSVYIRGLIEISNYCKNDCYYCGIRRSNSRCSRYRLTAEDILADELNLEETITESF